MRHHRRLDRISLVPVWNRPMPTPKDHRDVTIVVQPPVTSRRVAYELAYLGETDGKVYEAVHLDTPSADATFRELLVFENGRLVLDVRVYLAVTVDVRAGQAATKTVVSETRPPIDRTNIPLAPRPGAQWHVWSGEDLEVELLIEAVGDLSFPVVEVDAVRAGEWSISIKRSISGPQIAVGHLVVPSDLVKL
jgi:hypothetical protein